MAQNGTTARTGNATYLLENTPTQGSPHLLHHVLQLRSSPRLERGELHASWRRRVRQLHVELAGVQGSLAVQALEGLTVHSSQLVRGVGGGREGGRVGRREGGTEGRREGGTREGRGEGGREGGRESGKNEGFP